MVFERRDLISLAWAALFTLAVPIQAGDQPVVKFGENGEMRVKGKPFFPLFVWAQPSKNLKRLKAQGMNTIVSGEKASKDPRDKMLDKAKELGMYIILDQKEFNPAFTRHPALLCWKFGDEPDLWKKGGKPKVPFEVLQKTYAKVKAGDPNHPAWINLTPRFFGGYYKSYRKKQACPTREQYKLYAKSADVLSFDHYPVTGWNRPDRVHELYHATADFAELYKGKPIWVIVENADQNLKWTPKSTRGPSPKETKAMIWMCIVAGAKGIGYFPVAFGPFRWDNTTAEMKAMLKKENARITEMTGVLLEGKLEDSTSDNKQVKVRVLTHEGETTVIAVNLSRETQKATITVGDKKTEVELAALEVKIKAL